AEALTEVVTGIDAEVRLGGAGLGFLDVAVDIERGNAARDADAAADEEALMGAAEVLLADHAHAGAMQAQRVAVEAVVERGLVGVGVETLDREVGVEPVAAADAPAGVVVAGAAAVDAEVHVATAHFATDEAIALRKHRGRKTGQ